MQNFGQGEIAIGSIPVDGGTRRLPRFVGKSLAMQMILTGQTIDASQALRAGLVSEVTPSDQRVTRALEIARRIAELPTLAVQTPPLESVLSIDRDELHRQTDLQRIFKNHLNVWRTEWSRAEYGDRELVWKRARGGASI
jgi:enoyl-CoA hydratase/carnithine racemase